MVAQAKLGWKNQKGEWLKFQGVDRLTVVGNGQGLIDGQGDSWWRNVSSLFILTFLVHNNII